jgi:hypothetical protein
MSHEYGVCKYNPCTNPKCHLFHKGANVQDGTAEAFNPQNLDAFYNNLKKKAFTKKINKAGSIPEMCRDGEDCQFKHITCWYCHSAEEIRLLINKQEIKKQYFESKKQKPEKAKLQKQDVVIADVIAESSVESSASVESDDIVIKSLCVNGIPLQIVEDEIANLRKLSEKFDEKLSDNSVINAILLNYKSELENSIKNLESFYSQVGKIASEAEADSNNKAD